MAIANPFLDEGPAQEEPDDLPGIRALRPPGPRRLWGSLDPRSYSGRLEGALLGRMAGCTLGAPLEGWPVEKMKAWAETIGDDWPLADYWSAVPEPDMQRYGLSRCADYTRCGMRGVPVDDDIVYTLLGLLVLEESGPDFTTEDVAAAWLKYLPHACTAEEVALENLKADIPADRAAEVNNPYVEWIGAAIRADPWGYAAPGWPERAAEMAWRDASLSHRGTGIYGEMLFSAAVASAFAVSHPVEAIEVGLTEVPKGSQLAQAVRWALKVGPDLKDCDEARAAVDERFEGMNPVHTVNNACLTVFGLIIGGTDFTRVISQTMAMGLDNDCTAATAGSIAGAVVGRDGIPEHWYQGFGDEVHSYLVGKPTFNISDLLARFTKQARRVFG